MTRGNQRETDRARAQARAAKNAKSAKLPAGEVAKKHESDADAMRKKQQAADAKRQAAAGEAAKAAAGGQVVKQKIPL